MKPPTMQALCAIMLAAWCAKTSYDVSVLQSERRCLQEIDDASGVVPEKLGQMIEEKVQMATEKLQQELVKTMNQTADELHEFRRTTEAAKERVESIEAQIKEIKQASDERRRAQASAGDPAMIIKPQVVRCPADGCAGHRRTQSSASCDADELAWRTDDINSECCNDPSEDCSGGYPATCNAGCAALFLPFWDECHDMLGKSSSNYEPTVALCEAAVETAPSLAGQLNVQCSDGTPVAECVPECNEAVHGYLMLIDIEGEDVKLSCELRRGYYSWVGPSVRFALSRRSACFGACTDDTACLFADAGWLPRLGHPNFLFRCRECRRRGVRRLAP